MAAVHSYKRELTKSLGITIGSIVVILASTLFVGFDMRARAANIESLRREIDVRGRAVQSLVLLRTEADRAKAYGDDLDRLLPTEENLFVFRNKIRALAASEKVTLTFTFGTKNEGTADVPSSVNLRMTANGDAPALVRFLEGIERSGYFVELSSIEIAYSAKGKGAATAELAGRVFSK